jgi:hypothetical protein
VDILSSYRSSDQATEVRRVAYDVAGRHGLHTTRRNPDEDLRRLERAAAGGDHEAELALRAARHRANLCSRCGAARPYPDYEAGRSAVTWAMDADDLHLCHACAARAGLEDMQAVVYDERWGGYAKARPPGGGLAPVVTGFAGEPLIWGWSSRGESGFGRESFHWSGHDRYGRGWHGWNSGVGMHTKMRLSKATGKRPGRERVVDNSSARSLRQAQDEWMVAHGGPPLPAQFNPGPDEQLRELERAWRVSGDPLLLDQLVNAAQRADVHRGTDFYLAWLRSRWAELAARKRKLRLEIAAYRKTLTDRHPHRRRYSYSGRQQERECRLRDDSRPLAEELALELGRHGKLWATSISGYDFTSSIRLHDEKDNPKGAAASDWILWSKSSGEGSRGHATFDIKTFNKGRSSMRGYLEEMRSRYGARSRLLELRESEEALPAYQRSGAWDTPDEWVSLARGRGQEGRREKVVGWNPGDESMRRAQRRAARGDDLMAEAQVLRSRMRANALGLEEVRLAALAGHVPAQLAIDRPPTPFVNADDVMIAVSPDNEWGHRHAILWAYAVLRGTRWIWDEVIQALKATGPTLTGPYGALFWLVQLLRRPEGACVSDEEAALRMQAGVEDAQFAMYDAMYDAAELAETESAPISYALARSTGEWLRGLHGAVTAGGMDAHAHWTTRLWEGRPVARLRPEGRRSVSVPLSAYMAREAYRHAVWAVVLYRGGGEDSLERPSPLFDKAQVDVDRWAREVMISEGLLA